MRVAGQQARSREALIASYLSRVVSARMRRASGWMTSGLSTSAAAGSTHAHLSDFQSFIAAVDNRTHVESVSLEEFAECIRHSLRGRALPRFPTPKQTM
jgi:hypothetical protein